MSMDWHTIVVGVVSFFAGMATAIMLGAMAAAGQADAIMDERRAARDAQRSTHSTQHTQNTHTDTQST